MVVINNITKLSNVYNSNGIKSSTIIYKSLKSIYSSCSYSSNKYKSDHQLEQEATEYYLKKRQEEKRNSDIYKSDSNHYDQLESKLVQKSYLNHQYFFFPYLEKRDIGNLSYNDRSFLISYQHKFFKRSIYEFLSGFFTFPFNLFYSESFKNKIRDTQRKYELYDTYNSGSCREYNINYDKVKDIKNYACGYEILKLFKIKPLLDEIQPAIKSIDDFSLDLISPTSKIYKQFDKVLCNELSFINRTAKPYEASHIISYLLASVNLPNDYFYNNNNQLLKTIIYSGYYQLVDNEAIIKELDRLKIEDLKDILFNRSLEYKDLELEQMKSKFLKYSTLLKQLYQVEHGKPFRVDDLKIKSGWSFEKYTGIFPFNDINSDWSFGNNGLVKMKSTKYQDKYISMEHSIFYKQFILLNCLLNHYKL